MRCGCQCALAAARLPALEHRPHLVSPLAADAPGNGSTSALAPGPPAGGPRPQPTLLRRDSQSVKTTAQGGASGFDDGKIHGRKRHIWVDSLGLLLAVLVTGADVHDARAGCELFTAGCGTSCRAWRWSTPTPIHGPHYLDEEVFDSAPFRPRGGEPAADGSEGW